jgi:hypothetical protein
MKVDKIETRMDPLEPALARALDLKPLKKEMDVRPTAVPDLKTKERLEGVKSEVNTPKDTVDNPNFAALEKERLEAIIFQFFSKKTAKRQAIELEIMKRNDFRDYIKNLYVKDDSKSYFMSQMNEQRLRMLFTWIDRFIDEKKFRQLRELASIQYKDIQQMKKDAFMHLVKFEQLVATRKAELERTRPRINVLEEHRRDREEDLARLKLDKMKEKIIIQFDDRQRFAEYLIASTALEKIDQHRRIEVFIKDELFKGKDRLKALRKID